MSSDQPAEKALRTVNAPLIARCTIAFTTVTLAACSDGPSEPTAPGGPTTAVAVAFCTGPQPAWVAFQDGDGAWTRAQPALAGAVTTFNHVFTANRGAIATARRLPDGITTLSILYGAPHELAIAGDAGTQHCGLSRSNALLGSVAGLESNDVVVVSAGPASRAVAFPSPADVFELRDLTAGLQDVLATRLTSVDGSATLTGMILRRGLQLPDGAAIPAFDFRTPEVFLPEVRQVTITGLPPEGALLQTSFRTTRSEHVVAFGTTSVTATTRPFHAVPESRLEPGDLQVLAATTVPSNDNVRRSATLYFRSPSDRTLAFGPPPSAPRLDVVSNAPTLRLRAQFAPQTEYDRLTTIGFQQGPSRLVTVAMTSTYAGLTGAGYDLVVPELTGVEGFDSQWALRPGVATLWTASRVGGTLALGFDVVPTDGATRRGASDGGSIAP